MVPAGGAPSGGGHPVITGLSPKEGTPGQTITIRGENLGNDQSDLVALMICSTDCLMSAKWKSSTKIVARVGKAKRGLGDIVLITRSGGRGISSIQFRVFTQTTGPLEESAVWVDETRTVPGREAVRTIQETNENVDALGLTVNLADKMDLGTLSQKFPDGSSNRRMESFDPRYYLLENHSKTKLEDLRKGVRHMKKMAVMEAESSKDVHKANLYSLISCVDALAAFHDRLQLERNTRGWPLTMNLNDKISESRKTADKLFLDVLNRKDRADATRNALSILTRFRFIFFLPSSIDENLAKGEYSTILNDYTRAKSLFKDTDVELFKEVMQVLDEKMIALKSNLKQRLIDESKGLPGSSMAITATRARPIRNPGFSRVPAPQPTRFISTSAASRSGSSASWDGVPVVYTDGACSSNGRKNARAGYGVYWGDDHPDNVSKPLEGSAATNNRAELQAVVVALQQAVAKDLPRLTIKTDSQLIVKSTNQWMQGWKRKGWVTSNGQAVANQDLLKEIDKLMGQVHTNIEHVRGHAGVHGNEMADQLAVAGAERYNKL
ncbi:hypothetical protein L596_007827 [Steinernema carpocapsae]|uniref:Exocyst complex component 2 n=1 Tax=Steinernema carpocapsae TaxID=34508 RepID=A0A4U5PB51_STECR|nr:hypothetical protein L596_007827 [Steinernema carpocapsae]